jgi:hypothetical protein
MQYDDYNPDTLGDLRNSLKFPVQIDGGLLILSRNRESPAEWGVKNLEFKLKYSFTLLTN